MSIRTLSPVIIQISTMSALVTAMQPSVQSCEGSSRACGEGRSGDHGHDEEPGGQHCDAPASVRSWDRDLGTTERNRCGVPR